MTEDDVELLWSADERTFAELVRTHQSTLLRLAMAHTPSRAVAEEVVQETWLAILQGEDRPPGTTGLKMWLSGICLTIARRRAGVEARTVPLSAVGFDREPAMDPRRFQRDGVDAGHWASFPVSWTVLPEDVLLADEVRRLLAQVIAGLNPAQREVIVLRDIEGWSSAEVCQLLDLTDGHQRVLLHRARAKVRQSLEDYIGPRPAIPYSEPAL